MPTPKVEAYACQTWEAPRGEVEKALAKIWREALQVERVGRHDNFFVRGGHSLLAVKLIGLLKQAGIDITMNDLPKHTTVMSLAQCIKVNTLQWTTKSIAPIRTTGSQCPLFLIHEIVALTIISLY